MESIGTGGLLTGFMLKVTSDQRIYRLDTRQESDRLTRTTLFLLNRSQAVRLPKAVAFAETVRDVVIIPDGPRRIIAPAEAAWDDFFDAPGADLAPRDIYQFWRAGPSTVEQEAFKIRL